MNKLSRVSCPRALYCFQSIFDRFSRFEKNPGQMDERTLLQRCVDASKKQGVDQEKLLDVDPDFPSAFINHWIFYFRQDHFLISPFVFSLFFRLPRFAQFFHIFFFPLYYTQRNSKQLKLSDSGQKETTAVLLHFGLEQFNLLTLIPLLPKSYLHMHTVGCV